MCYLHRFSLAELLVDGTVFQPVKKKESYESYILHILFYCVVQRLEIIKGSITNEFSKIKLIKISL